MKQILDFEKLRVAPLEEIVDGYIFHEIQTFIIAFSITFNINLQFVPKVCQVMCGLHVSTQKT
jgi:hypothetical protein